MALFRVFQRSLVYKRTADLTRKTITLHVTSEAPCSFHTSSRRHDVFSVQDEEDFEEKVLKSKKPVIVEFHAKWCGPCKVLMPRLEGAVQNNDKVDLAQIDIDEHPEIAMSYNVGAVPSVLGMKDGKIVDKFVGLKDEDQLETFVKNISK